MRDELKNAFDDIRNESRSNDRLVREGNRPCPICGSIMALESRFNVIVDVCREHGIWLDKGELPRITERIECHQRVEVRKARRDGKVSGALWGWWSLLGD